MPVLSVVAMAVTIALLRNTRFSNASLDRAVMLFGSITMNAAPDRVSKVSIVDCCSVDNEAEDEVFYDEALTTNSCVLELFSFGLGLGLGLVSENGRRSKGSQVKLMQNRCIIAR